MRNNFAKRIICIIAAIVVALSLRLLIYAESVTTDELLVKIEALEARVAVLEAIVGSGETDSKTDVTSEVETPASLTQGIYIVGEDIEAGKYNFSVVKSIGAVYTYSSYDTYKNDQYDFDEMYEMASQDYLDGIAQDENLGYFASLISTGADNVRLIDGMCLRIDTVTVEVTKVD